MSDGEEIRRAWWWTHESDTARLGAWSKDDARLFRGELESALRALAARVVDDVASGLAKAAAAEEKVGAR